MDALGALGPLAGAMTGRGDGFTDEGPRERGKPANFAEDSHARPGGGQQNSGPDGAPITKPDPSASAAPLRPGAAGSRCGRGSAQPGTDVARVWSTRRAVRCWTA